MTDGSAFTEERTRAAVEHAAQAAAITTSKPRLVRLGENAVFRLDGGIVARVARSNHAEADVRRTLRVASWLNDSGVPAVEPVDVDQPFVDAGLAVSLWHSLGDRDRWGTTTDLGRLLGELHELEPPNDLRLPPLDPFDRADYRLARAPISEDIRSFLQDRGSQLRERYSALSFLLPEGVIHGDANVGNVLVDEQDVPRLIDLDGVSRGPREWDLILTAIYYDRYGWHTEAEYRAFSGSYGYNVMAWNGYETLADVREFLMLTWMSQNVGASDGVTIEFRKRVDSLVRGRGRMAWKPF